MDPRQEPEPPDLSLRLPRDLYWLVLHTLRGLLPPPDTDAPDAETRRDHAAIALVASMLPGNAEEADLASRCVAHGAYGMHCLRQARVYRNDLSVFLKCNAQAASMERRAQSGRSLLQRLQAERRKREADSAATEQAAWVEHCAIGLMADALDQAPPLAASEPPPAPQPPAKEDPEALVAEADLFATMYPRRAAVIRARGGLPEPWDFTPLRPALVHAIVASTSPTLRALDQRSNTAPAAA
ncbi:MAG TPA: hypothetical protein VKI44_27735 [Acetobacteraceae bacterium]|nr:hypothetical protein [Acetobacteraceae bacterium]